MYMYAQNRVISIVSVLYRCQDKYQLSIGTHCNSPAAFGTKIEQVSES